VSFNTITVTGKFQDVAENYLGGTITFTPNFAQEVDTVSSVVFFPAGQTATIHPSSAGFSIGPIACTDSTDMGGGGFEYLVTVNLSGLTPWSFTLSLPHSLGSTVDLSQLSP
jgi:hypothetical protein